jgi:hypothetical protein
VFLEDVDLFSRLSGLVRIVGQLLSEFQADDPWASCSRYFRIAPSSGICFFGIRESDLVNFFETEKGHVLIDSRRHQLRDWPWSQ